MPDPLSELIDDRATMLRRISEIGDFQPGSITSASRRCGKPGCHCAKPDDPGHGPHAQLTQKIDGKTVTQNLPSRAAVRKAESEIAEFRRFQTLTSGLVDVNRDLPFATRRANRGACPGKKTAQAIQQEVAREVDRLLNAIFRDRRKTGHLDLEAIEMAVRSAMHQAGATALSELLQFSAPAADQRTIPCPCGHRASYQELRAKPVLTAVGPAKVSRPYYVCSRCHSGQFPADVNLDIEDTELSPGVRRMQAVVGQEAPFDHGRRQMKLLADLEVTTKSVERTAEAIGEDIVVREHEQIQRAVQLDLPVIVGQPIAILHVQMDGTGVPVVNKETVGRQGKTEGQPSHTREAKLGCVFTQTTWDQEGLALRDPDSTTYVAAIEPAEQFGLHLYLEACKRGWSRAEKKVVIGDGAEWIWNIADQHFPGAIQIVDLFHARQHLWELVRKLYSNQQAQQEQWMLVHKDILLDGGKIEELVASLRSIDSANPELAEKIRIEADYFEKNTERMRYPTFRAQHLFVGSGVIEAGCKTIIGSRCKQSGMFWTVRGANAILALRCSYFNGRFEDYWEARRAA